MIRLWTILGFRNVWRNPRRSLLTALIIAVGVSSLMLTDGFIAGMLKTLVDTQTQIWMGHAQIHNPKYTDSYELEHTIENQNEIISKLKQTTSIKNFSKRVYQLGVIASSYNSLRVQISGVELENEKHTSKLNEAIVSGNIKDKLSKNEIILGKKLAELLEVDLDDKIVLTFNKKNSSDISQHMFRVKALANFNARILDKNFAFINLQQAQELFALDDNFHEIVIRYNNINNKKSSQQVKKYFSTKDIKFENWEELSPSLKSMVDMSSYSNLIISIILFIFILLSIMNTVFMIIMERSHEIGVLRAIGTQKKQIILMLNVESAMLGLLGVFLGLLLGTSILLWFAHYGISYADMEINGISLVEPIKTIPRIEQFTIIPISIWIMTLISSIYPSIYAAKILIQQAMQKTL
jgi:ABC-type lipoprotein release transport system permease subunit